jgi:hypothetical protein
VKAILGGYGYTASNEEVALGRLELDFQEEP